MNEERPKIDAQPYVVIGGVSVADAPMVWQATVQLRWLNGVLQQFWQGHNFARAETEWRDVPVVEEANAG